MTKRELESGRELYPLDEVFDIPRPRTRGDCEGIPRPCPFVSCTMNNYLDVSKKGSVKLNFPDLEPGEMPAETSCALDVAEQHGVTLERAAEIMNLTRERIRQLENAVIDRVRASDESVVSALREDFGATIPRTKRRLPILEDDEPETCGGRQFDVERFISDELDAH